MPNQAKPDDWTSSLAERAKANGKQAGALFFWLLRDKKTMFITQAEEDAAVTYIRALRNPDNRRDVREEQWEKKSGGAQETVELSGDERFVFVCIRIAKQKRIDDPYRVAKIKDWSRAR